MKRSVASVLVVAVLGLLQQPLVGLAADVTLQLDGVQVQSHSVVYYNDISQPVNTNADSLQCLTDNPDCCYGPTGGHWYSPNGTEVTGDSNAAVYRTRGGRDQPLAAVYLHRDPAVGAVAIANVAGVGLYRCEIPTSGTHGDIKVAYVGVYVRGGGSGTPTISEALQFTRAVEGIDQPGDSPVFTLTCNSGGGPTTTVTWKRDGTVVSEDSNHVMTSGLVDQSGPDYTSTLTVTGREDGLYTCTVTNDIGSADGQFQVEAAGPPTDVSAVQVDGNTTVMVSWTAPTGATPTGYRIYYQEAGDSTVIPIDTGPNATERLLEGLSAGTTYTIRMLTRSQHLPSSVTAPEMVTIVQPPAMPVITSSVTQSPTSVRIVWEAESGVDGYEIMFERVTGSDQFLCTDYVHSGTVTAGGSDTEYTLTDLQEYSFYTFSLVAVVTGAGTEVKSNPATVDVLTLAAAPSSAPQDLRNTSTDETSITVQWGAVDCIDRNSEITGYVLRFGEASSDQREVDEVTAGSGDEGGMYVIATLSPLTPYYIEVAAVSDDGIGPFTNITVQTPLYAPDNPQAAKGEVTFTTIRIMWEGQEFVDSHRISFERVTGGQEAVCPDVSHTGMETVGGSSTGYTVMDLQEYSNYSITVTAVNTAGETPSTLNVTTLQAGPTGAPQNFTTSEVNSRNITVQWSTVDCINRNSEITDYVLRYGEASSDQREEAVITGSGDEGGTSTITGLTPYTEYAIEVAAVNSDSQTGPFANITARTLEDIPGPVVSLSATPYPTSLQLTWSAPLLPNGVITAYEVSHQLQGGMELGRENTTGVQTAHTVTGLRPQTNYTVTVRAYTIAGSGEERSMTETTEPIPPVQDVVVDVLSSTSVRVSWTAIQVTEVTGYRVFYSSTNPSGKKREVTSPSGSPSGESNVTVSGPPAVVTGLSPGQSYQFQVQALVEVDGETLEGERSESESATVAEETTGGGGGGGDGGAVAGAVVGVLLAVAIVAVIVVIVVLVIIRRRKHKKDIEGIKVTYRPTDDGVYTAVDGGEAEKLQAPVFEEFPEKGIHVKEGETILFQPQVTGTPTPFLTWYFQDEKVTEDYSISLGQNGTLTVHSAEPRHAGVFRLLAVNDAGSVSREVEVTLLEDDEPDPTAPTMTFNPIPLQDFGEYVAANHAHSNQGFKDQYTSLDSGREHGLTIGLSSTNKHKNKFANIAVYDDNRIILQPIPGHQDCQDPYINACYVDGYSLKNKFIATQAPLTKTLVDFWRLVWQERPPAIVMVTNLKEGSKVKCQQYWPDSGTKSFGPFEVTITDQQTFADYSLRIFHVAFSGSSERPINVTQFHFTAWPDHGVPDYATSILEFHRRIRSKHNPRKGPLMVHCSAGVGRTGTYITIDSVLEQIQREHVVDIASIINKLRHQRMKMVQTVDQYIFIHDAILEAITCGDTQIPASDVYIALGRLRAQDPSTGVTMLESQFHVLNQVTPKPKEVPRKVAFQHQYKNRSMDYVPSDHWRVPVKGEHPDYIHASFVNGYKQRKALIIAQSPMESTCRDFWKMVYERKCGAIVMLTHLHERGQEVCHQYWPQDGYQEYKVMGVELVDELKKDGYIVRSLNVTKRGEDPHRVTQFQIQNWTSSGQCANFHSVLEVIDEVGKVQRKTGNTPVVVHCSDTVSRSGMFCAIATTIERCKTEGVVDVFQVVKALRVQKPGAVATVEQFSCIFDVVLMFLDSFDTYANFK